MAKTNKNTRQNISKPRPSNHKANAAGYAKRRSQKAKAIALSDVYEYAPSKVRRSKVTLDLDREEAADHGPARGGDGDSEDGYGREELKARLIGENGDEEIDSEDDEDVDSDAAFEESDEEKFSGFDFSRKGNKKATSTKKKAKKAQKSLPEVDLNEEDDVSQSESEPDDDDGDEDDEMEGEEGDEFFDVLDVFDGKADEDDSAEKGNTKKSSTKKEKQRIPSKKKRESEEDDDEEMGEDEEMDEDEDDETVDENEVDEPSDLDDPSPEALAELGKYIQSLDPSDNKKRKAPIDGETGETTTEQVRERKRRMLKERTEAGPEGEFGAQTGGSQKLNLDDLLAPLASSSSALASLKKATKPLASTSTKAIKTLSAPLPQRTQERLDREAAYEQTKAEVDKWSATMKRIKEAEHLSFPLQAQPMVRPSNLELAAKFKPTTELESAVDKLLKAAQMREEDIAKTEDLQMAHLSVEEVAARRAELRSMRELAFRAEVKAKRVAKIKSKTYRRIRKKQREKLDGEEREAAEEEDDEDATLKREVERARERATLRHNNTGKWAKAMKGREGLDIDQRREIGEMLERGERLRRKIRGERGSQDGSGDDDDNSDDDTEKGVDDLKRDAFEELANLADGTTPEPTDQGKSKSVFDMKFMRDAAARRERETDAMVDDFAREMGVSRQRGDDESNDEIDVDVSEEGGNIDGSVVQRTGGRMVFRPGGLNTAINLRPTGSLASDISSVTLRSADLLQEPPSPQHSLSTETSRAQVSLPPPSASVPESNPWLAHSSTAHAPRKKNETLVQKDSTTLSKAANKLKKQVQKSGEEKDRVREDATLEINLGDVLKLPEDTVASGSKPSEVSHVASKKKGKSKAKKEPVKSSNPIEHNDDDSDVHSEVEEQERALEQKGDKKGKSVKAFEQRDLVALAFAGDNVVQEFEEAKRREMEADAPREIDTTLPGWGSWGGSGTSKAPPKPHLVKKIAGIDPASRADYKKAHVIISERRDKKAAKYLVKELPHPYTSHAQFERSMAVPLGAEWNTRVSFQRGTLPRVVKKMGKVIDPLEKLF